MNFPIIKKTNKLERIFILAALLILGLIIGSVIGVIYPLVTGQDVMSLNSLRFMQISSQIFTFVLPPILYVMLINENPKESLGIKSVSYHWFIIGFVMMYAILPLNNVFAEWNAGLKLPESMSSSSFQNAPGLSIVIIMVAFYLAKIGKFLYFHENC